MSEEQLKAFLEKVKADTSLQEKLKEASDSDAVLAIAKEAGFSISADDLAKAQSELSEEELEGLAGGVNWVSYLGTVIGCMVKKDVNSGLCNGMPYTKFL
jgi:predicted ribosomally synthesized peptide with nif11-like leader